MAHDYNYAEVDRNDGLVEIRLHYEGGPFRWNGETGGELAELFGELSRDPDVRVVILGGTGDRYCDQGINLDPFPPFTARDWEEIRWHGEQLMGNLLNIPAPIIACINGPVIAHPEIPLLSDIVLAADDSTVQDSGHILINVTPSDGLHVFMPLLMGLTRARYFLLTGQTLTAQQALDFGLVNELMPRDELLPRARELAAELLKKNPLVLRYTRLALTHQVKKLCHELIGYGGALEGLAVIDQAVQAEKADNQ